ncbi:MAG TPA: hypothetical protein VE777_02115 [Gaiellales bacterium]|nr:hypothetical protein [Gaiellales bacterium]
MPIGDVWGAILADELAGTPAAEIVERDDGHLMTFQSRYLLAPFRAWEDDAERRAMRFVRGRVLDVGWGGGLNVGEPVVPPRAPSFRMSRAAIAPARTRSRLRRGC